MEATTRMRTAAERVVEFLATGPDGAMRVPSGSRLAPSDLQTTAGTVRHG